MIYIRLDDDGPGIPEEDRERIFQPFVRLGETSDGGSGLGLALVHRIITGQGGQITVGSSPSDGARFEITLPDRQCQKRQPQLLTEGASA